MSAEEISREDFDFERELQQSEAMTEQDLDQELLRRGIDADRSILELRIRLFDTLHKGKPSGRA